ncbi:MAG: hypothetical protein H6608_11765 [Flavobacteriales bacterium]|nr:hypothetical protein [Bacteroidota bacterium]MCB9241805.1 hypothetical protein [Flavobacteriales bacterium]
MSQSLHLIVLAYNRPESLRRTLRSLSVAFEHSKLEVSIELSLEFNSHPDCERHFQALAWPIGEKVIHRNVRPLGVDQHTLECLKRAEAKKWTLLLEDDHFASPIMSHALEFLLSTSVSCAGFSLHHYTLHPISELPFIPIDKGGDFYLAKRPTSRGFLFQSSQIKSFNAWRTANDGSTVELPTHLERYGESNWETVFGKYLISTNQYILYPYQSYLTVYGEAGVHLTGTDDRTIAQSPMPMVAESLEIAPQLVHYDEWLEYELTPGELQNLNLPELQSTSVCLDIQGCRKRYATTHVITSRRVKQSIADFGMDLVPAELNILYSNSGDELHLAKSEDVLSDNPISIQKRKLMLRMYYNQRYSVVELIVNLVRRLFYNKLQR